MSTGCPPLCGRRRRTESNPKEDAGSRFRAFPWRSAAAVGVLVMASTFLPTAEPAYAAAIQEPLEGSGTAILRNGRSLYLACRPPAGDAAKRFLERVLDPHIVAIPCRQLNPETQRKPLLAVFPEDYVDSEGWHHKVRAGGNRLGQETLLVLSDWLTGNAFNDEMIRHANRLGEAPLAAGQ